MAHSTERIEEGTEDLTETEILKSEKEMRCCSLRGIQWRIKLGVLPNMISSSVDELRRAAADGRRKYADLRRRFLVDPHMEEGQKTAHLNMDNPLSQDPESVWGRFFRNAELERSIDKDLSRLYPEHGSYFQTSACQAMLRRILLVWSLTHSEHSYRQGMHELLAPLLYVLHVDITHLSHVKHLFENLSDERFDGLSLQENNVSPRGNFEKQMNMSPVGKKVSSIVEDDRRLSDYGGMDILKCQANLTRISSIDEFDPSVRAIFSGSDAYGAEGELGALLSERFIEHDAYCMFDALLSGQGGPLAMADYFMNSAEDGSALGLSPVIEASAQLYNLLAVVDVSLYGHLVELHVEPQFFALRWLRVLFGREFLLHDLLLVWDAIFLTPNTHSLFTRDGNHVNNIVCCDRAAFISAMAVSMLLHLRPSLLATPDATTCLQKLLNFPHGADVGKLIENAVSLQPLAMNTMSTTPSLAKMGWSSDYARMGKLTRSRSVNSPCQMPMISHRSAVQNQICSPCSPDRLRVPLPESYWEERWRTSILQKVTPEKSSNQEVLDGNGTDSAGQGGEIISIDSSIQQCLVFDSDGQRKQHILRKENCETLLKQGEESISSTHDRKNATIVEATGHKLLDEEFNNTNSQIESDVKHIQANESNVGRLSEEEQKYEGMDAEYQKANGLGESCRDGVDQEGFDQHMSSSQALLVTDSGEEKVSECDTNGVSKIGIGDQEKLPNQSKEGNNGLCQLNNSKISPSAMKEPPGKSVSSNASQTGGVLTFWRKQKPLAAAHPSRFRWIWNFGRNIPGAKVNTDPSKDELPADNIDSAPSKKLSQEDDNDVADDEFTQTNIDSDYRKSEGNNHLHGEKSIVEFRKDESATNGADLGDEKQLSKENVSPGMQAISESLENRFSANTLDSHDKWSSQENITSSDVAVPYTPCLQQVLDKDSDSVACNADLKGTKGPNSLLVSDASQSSMETKTVSTEENPSINLRIMGQFMLEKIQVLESLFSGDIRLEKDAAALNALKELQDISNKLLQM